MTARAFLNVTGSLTGRRWIGPGVEAERLAEAMGQLTRLPPAVCQTLVARGVAPDQAESFLNPALRDLLPDPLALKDMGAAAARFLQALQNRQRIAIFADYDVDGGSSAALLILWLRAMGAKATLYIPDRIDEGYGPNVPAMQALGRDHDLILCVDCGTLSHEPIAAAGCDVIVLDHHLGAETLPAALAVVNPNRQDEPGDLAHLFAAGVVFLMLVEANRQLRNLGRQGPDLMGFLDLVALATVADVAPLIGVNRAFVRQGLRVMARRERIGLTALADIARMDQAPTPYALGFVLGPRINAGGRIGQADLGARLLASDNPAEAMAMAARLDELNSERREITEAVRAEAMAQAEARGVEGALVWAAAEGWHPGVVGIVAARLKEATHRPAVVIGFENGIGKGSARSISGVDLGAAVQRVAAEGLLLKGGGHKMAAGLTVAYGHDCVLDPWYSGGSGDMLEAAHMGLHVGQMTSQAGMRQCFDAVTVNPARLLGLEGYGIVPGCHADFVLLHARNPAEAIRLRAARLGVWRRGKRVASQPSPIAALHLPGRPSTVNFI